MRILKKYSAIMLAFALLLGVVAVGSLFTVSGQDLPAKLIELDYTNFVQDTSTDPDNTWTNIGNVANNGSLAGTTVVMSSLPRYNNMCLVKELIFHQDGTYKPILHFTQDGYAARDNNRFRVIEQKGLEEQANTISFWVKYKPVAYADTDVAQEISLLDYTVDYSEIEEGTNHLVSLDAKGNPEGTFVLYDKGQNVEYLKNIDEIANDKWINLTLTNPVYEFARTEHDEETGVDTDIYEKEMKVYLNGEYLGSKIVAKPAGELQNAKICIAGASPDDHKIYYPKDINLGDLDVYTGVLTDEQVAEVYSNEASDYVGVEKASTETRETLIDLDLSNVALTKEKGSASGIVNKGTSENAEIVAYSTNDVAVSADYLYDSATGAESKKVVRVKHNSIQGINGYPLSKHFDITDPAFETRDITLSFWTNVDPISKQSTGSAFCAIAQYNIKTSDDSFVSAKVWQRTLDTDNEYFWSMLWERYLLKINKEKQWHHVVMTIPKDYYNRSKNVELYIDGQHALTEQLTLPEDVDVQGAIITLAGDEKNTHIPGDISFSDIRVYSSCFSAADVETLYNGERGVFDGSAHDAVKVTYAGAAINKLTNVEGGKDVTISFNESFGTGIKIYAATYSEDEILLTSEIADANESGSFTLEVPADADRLSIFTWDDTSIEPMQKYVDLYR